MARNFKVLGGILFGAVCGVCAGVLFAPASGRQTRQKLWQQLQNLRNNSGHFLEEAKEKTGNVITKTLGAIDTGFEKIGQMINHKRPQQNQQDQQSAQPIVAGPREGRSRT